MSSAITFRIVIGAVLSGAALTLGDSVRAQGISLTGIGPINRSMGGAGTAAPLDAMGALHWNPGSISALPGNELGVGLEMLYADIQLTSNFGGRTSGDAGWTPIPEIGWVHHLEDTPWTAGLGLFGVGGFKNNLPANPTLQGASGSASAEILQVAPTLSYQLTKQLSVGVAPTITTITLNLDPLGPSVITPTPTPGQGNRLHWGVGFQTGVYYRADCGFNAGFTFKSPQWIETLHFFTPDGTVKFDLDYPMILSLGFSYTGFEKWVFAIDGRYFDYAHTDDFRELGWRSVFAGAIGTQYRINDQWTARVGYNINQDPINSGNIALNILDPLTQEQNVAAGVSYRFSQRVDFNVAYVHLLHTRVSGPLGGGATVPHDLQAHSAILGITVRY